MLSFPQKVRDADDSVQSRSSMNELLAMSSKARGK